MTELKGIVRIADADVIGTKTLYYALRKVTGVSFMMANAACIISGLGRDTLVGSLSDEQLKKIENLLKNPQGIPTWLYNRRRDHTSDLENLSESRSQREVRRVKWEILRKLEESIQDHPILGRETELIERNLF